MLRRLLLFLAGQRWLYRIIVGNSVFRRMAYRFVAGDRLEDALEVARTLQGQGITATLDHLGEDIRNASEARGAADVYVRALDEIAARGLTANVSLKLTALGMDIDPTLCWENIRRVLDTARRHENFVRIDMEDSAHTQPTLDFFKQLWQEYQNVGMVIQTYLYRSEADVRDLNAMGARVRLCKGAYNEPPDVAFPAKADVDANYLKLAEILIVDGTYPGMATHDEAIIDSIIEFCRENSIPPDRFEFQMLYGIRRDLQEKLVRDGWRMRVYVPFGEQWYPYFMRRLAERPANVMFILKALFRR